MGKIKSFLDSIEVKKDFDTAALAMLTASAVLRKEKNLREILAVLKERQFNSKKIYEALLQTYLFAGYPSALISLSIFSEYFNDKKEKSEAWDIRSFKLRGEQNCRKIYGNKFEKLIDNIGSYSPELSDWLVTEGYGKVFGRKGLALREREVCNIAVLAALKFESQLYSHINGGHRLGMEWGEIERVIEVIALLGRRDCAEFGLKVLELVMERKGK